MLNLEEEDAEVFFTQQTAHAQTEEEIRRLQSSIYRKEREVARQQRTL